MLKFGLRSLTLLILLILSITLVACGKTNTSPATISCSRLQAGKDYEIISSSTIIPKLSPTNQVLVIEFFSYGCPACYHMEPILEKWITKQPTYVKFDRVPIIFQPAWQNLAQAFYTAKMLGLEKKLTPAIFKAIHVEGKNLADPKIQEDFFIKQGVSQQAFESIVSFSPGIGAQLLKSNTLMKEDKILAAPTFVINNRYKVDPSMVNGDPTRFFQVVDCLIQKAKKGEE